MHRGLPLVAGFANLYPLGCGECRLVCYYPLSSQRLCTVLVFFWWSFAWSTRRVLRPWEIISDMRWDRSIHVLLLVLATEYVSYTCVYVILSDGSWFFHLVSEGVRVLLTLRYDGVHFRWIRSWHEKYRPTSRLGWVPQVWQVDAIDEEFASGGYVELSSLFDVNMYIQ